VLATSTAAHRTGTISLLDTFGTVGNPQAVRLGSGALTPGLEGAALKARLKDGPILKVTVTELKILWAYPVRYGLFVHCREKSAHRDLCRLPAGMFSRYKA